jgi:beta-xylosidase
MRWRDPAVPVEERVADLLGRMTLEEKVAQLYGLWVGVAPDGEAVAPHQEESTGPLPSWDAVLAHGLGQLTRPFGTAPVDPALGVRALARAQAEIVAGNRFGIPAMAHEECLAGFTAWQATIYPVPLAWGSAWDADLVEQMAAQIGTSLRSVGVHQGLAPVLDVVRDPRWGRTEETIGEDPYLTATIGTAYVRGLESAGVVATLKHFVGYSASRAGRNLAPVEIGARQLADVLLLPFEMAIREGGARSVMQSYTEIDGVPVAADPSLLTGLLREDWGFGGTVVADYFGITMLHTLHGVAGSDEDAGTLALAAGVDVELPTVRCYAPLPDAVRAGAVPEDLVDRAARRVLRQKCTLGLLDPDWSPGPVDAERGTVDLDPAPARALARRLAEESVVLLANDGTLPLAPSTRLAVVGPRAGDPYAMLGCYSFPSHVGSQHPDLPLGVQIPTVSDCLPGAVYVPGCTVDGDDRSGFGAAVAAARDADVCIAVLGDRSGLFGRGTSGEGCDAADLHLPGVQHDLAEALLETGTPVVVVLLTGRPYALGGLAERAAAVVQAFFPGEEGGPAIADVLTGRVTPSGRLPVSVPRHAGGQPATYLAPPLGHANGASTIDPAPLYPFGHGLSYTTFDWTDAVVDRDTSPTDGAVTVSCTVTNQGPVPGAEVVQLYLHDPVAQVTRPVVRLIGYARVPLRPGESRRVSFRVHADLTSFTGREGRRIVEPGDLELRLAASSWDVRHVLRYRLVGPERTVGHDRELVTVVTVR